MGFEYGVHVDSVGRSGGLALVWRKDWDMVIRSFSQAYIDAFITSPDGNSWRFTGFYGHPEKAQRHHCWELLRQLRGLFTLPWFVAGDFNEILHSFERKDGRDRYDSSMRGFGDAVNGCELIDLGFQGAALTWNNNQDPPKNVQKRLDWCLADIRWKSLFDRARVFYRDFFGFDHKALHVFLDFPSTNQYVVDMVIGVLLLNRCGILMMAIRMFSFRLYVNWLLMKMEGSLLILWKDVQVLSKFGVRTFLGAFQNRLEPCKRNWPI